MKLQKKFQLSALFSFGSIILIVVLLVHLIAEVNENLKISRLYYNLSQKTLALNGLSFEQLIRPSERVTYQWKQVYASLGELIEDLMLQNPEESKLLNRIYRDHQDLNELMDRLVQSQQAFYLNRNLDQLRERIAGRLSVKLSSMVSKAATLMDTNHLHLQRKQRQLAFITVLLIVSVMLLNALIILFSGSDLIRSISIMQYGTQQVAQGNFDHSISLDRKDEIGELSYSFDLMIQRLREFNLALNRKIEEYQRAESALLTYSRKLEISYSEMEAFSYSVSHDLRAPLRSLAGFSQMLLEDYERDLPPTAQDMLHRISNAAKRMGVMIDDLLRLSRIGRSPIDSSEIDLSSMARAIADNLQEQEPERQAEWIIESDLSDYGDSHLIYLALENLMGNAWKFTSKRPKAVIEFGRFSNDGKRVYYLRDNGAGFDMTYADKVFLPFQRLHNNDEFPGSGIGLALVLRIIQRHRGEIWAESQLDHGTIIFFHLGEKSA